MTASPTTLYVSDLDGTLLGADSKISPESARMLNEAIAKGALFSVATARTPSTVASLLRDVDSRLPFIVMTGSAMWDQATQSYSDVIHISTPDAERVVKALHSHSLPSFIYTLSNGVINIYHYGPLSETEKEFISQRDDSQFKIFHIPESGTSILPEPLENVVLFYAMQPSARSEAAYHDIRRIEGCNPIYYHDLYGPDLGILEVFSSKASKANALRRLKEQTGAERVVVFGDNINDLPMMREADLAVAVENAVAEVKEAADIIIGPNTSDSVARYILDATLKEASPIGQSVQAPAGAPTNS